MKKLTIIVLFVLLSVVFCACSSNEKIVEHSTFSTSDVAERDVDSTTIVASNDESKNIEPETQTTKTNKPIKKEDKNYNVENETTVPKPDVNGDLVITKGENNKVVETTAEHQIPTTKKEPKTTATTKPETKKDKIENNSKEPQTESDNIHVNASDLI